MMRAALIYLVFLSIAAAYPLFGSSDESSSESEQEVTTVETLHEEILETTVPYESSRHYAEHVEAIVETTVDPEARRDSAESEQDNVETTVHSETQQNSEESQQENVETTVHTEEVKEESESMEQENVETTVEPESRRDLAESEQEIVETTVAPEAHRDAALEETVEVVGLKVSLQRNQYLQTTVDPYAHQADAHEDTVETTVASQAAEDSAHEETVETTTASHEDTVPYRSPDEDEHQSITTEETTVIEETPAPVDQTRVDEAQRVEEGSETEQPIEGTTSHPPELPTAMAQMMGQLEIRLIDENNTQTHVESVIEPPPLSPITPYVTDSEHETTPVAEGENQDHSTPDPETEQARNAEYDAKWKRVEYVSDTALNLDEITTVNPEWTTTESTTPRSSSSEEQQGRTAAEGEEQSDTASTSDEEVVTSTPDATLATAHEEDSSELATTTLSPMDQVALQKIQSAMELGMAKKMPEGPFPDAVTDEDLPHIEGLNVDDEEEDPEPVEECLANRYQLSDEVVYKIERQVERYSRMVRKLGKQQTQYCTVTAEEYGEKHIFTDTYSQCPIWREEKIVHYYKLMRLTYCSDYSSWPNGSKMVKTYGQYLPLFETLYAFQKQ